MMTRPTSVLAQRALRALSRQRFALIAALSGASMLSACGSGNDASSTSEAADEQSDELTAQATETTWTRIAGEGQTFAFSGTKTVRYGVGSLWIQRQLTAGGTCTNAFFRADPAMYRFKECQIENSAPPAPAPTPTACDTLDKRLHTTTVSVGGNAAPNDEYTPAVIAPRNDGSSLLAWTDRGTQSIKMAALTASDAVGHFLPGVAGLEVHAMLATPSGAAMAVVANDPDIYSSKYCKGSSTPDKSVCGKMDLVRVDAGGNQASRTTLTKKGKVDSEGAQFIWWYGHTARLATDGSKIAVYYRSAMSTARPGTPGEVDIHAGDTLKFVDANGALTAGGWDWGCSHSWSVRAAYNGARWNLACHGDAYPNAMQVARFDTSASAVGNLQWLTGTDPAQRALGGLVPVAGGHWLNYIESEGGRLVLKLAKVADSGSALESPKTVTAAAALDAEYPTRPYMAALGTGKLLMGWKSGGKLVLAVADATTGVLLEGPVVTSLKVDNFQDFATAANGDVLWAYSDGGSSIQVNRVRACKQN